MNHVISRFAFPRACFAWTALAVRVFLFMLSVATANALGDLTQWTFASLSSSGGGYAWNGRLLVSVGEAGGIRTSPDGFTWTSRASGTQNNLNGVTWGHGQFVTVGALGTILTSSDGATWMARTPPRTDMLVGVTWGGDQFVAVGVSGVIDTSPDGVTWTASYRDGAINRLWNVAWSGTRYVAVGGDATCVLTSDDGATWTKRLGSYVYSLHDVTWTGGQFVAVGNSGTILTSPDGVNWVKQVSGTTEPLLCVASDGRRIVAGGGDSLFGSGAVMLASPDGVAWSRLDPGGGSRTFYDILWTGDAFVGEGSEAIVMSDRIVPAPVILVSPENKTAVVGEKVAFAVVVDGSSPFGYEWRKNGETIPGAKGSTLGLDAVQLTDVGRYEVIATDAKGCTATSAALLGVTATVKVTGSGTELAANIQHPNGKVFDQVLMTGAAEAITADWPVNQVTRTSFIDVDNDIVQVEFSGPGTLSLVLDGFSGPARPVNYNQATDYEKGHAGIVIAGADERTNVSVFTVGRATAFDPTGGYNILLAPSADNVPTANGSSIFQGHDSTAYDGIADLAYIAITSTNGKFGGVRAANAQFFADRGIAGVYAPGVEFTGPLYVGDITAFASARSVIIVGSAADVRVTGGDLIQNNGQPVSVRGFNKLLFTDGSTSGGALLKAQPNRAVLERDGVDVTKQLVAQ